MNESLSKQMQVSVSWRCKDQSMWRLLSPNVALEITLSEKQTDINVMLSA